MKVKPVTLEGENVKLKPLRIDHLPALCKVGLDESLWKWTANVVTSNKHLENYVCKAIVERELGTSLPFVTIDQASGKVVGSTRFGNIDVFNRKVEIGWTWINPQWQRTAINTEAKLLMLTHAFEVWDCIRVELKTDANNKVSQKAMKRIGAKREGVLRNHMITESGRYRDSVYFSIIDTEWESVKANLTSKLAARA